MKCLIVLSAFLSATYALSCYSGTNSSAVVGVCSKGNETSCRGPEWTAYTGYADDVPFDCGNCTGIPNCANCTDENCNAPVTVDTFGCFAWTYVNSTWQQSNEATECKITGDEKKMCNAPDRNVAGPGNYTLMLGGCGPCTLAEKTAKNCLECEKDECNSSAALSISFLLAALLAAFYTM